MKTQIINFLIKIWFFLFHSKKIENKESESAKNFYKNFKTEQDLRKEIGRLSYTSGSVSVLSTLINNNIGPCVIKQQKNKVSFLFNRWEADDREIVFTL